MASIRADGHEVPVVFPLDEEGFATVSTHLLHVRFKFIESSLYVEEEKHSESGEIQESIPIARSNGSDSSVGTYVPEIIEHTVPRPITDATPVCTDRKSPIC